MSKDICLECGRDRNIVGRAHRCVPIPGWVKPRPPEVGPEIHEPPSAPVRKAKAPPAIRKTTPRPISEAREDEEFEAVSRREKILDLSQMSGGPIGASSEQPVETPAAQAAKPRPENRKDKKVVTAYLEPEQVKRLRIMAAQTGVSMETMLGKIIDAEWLARQRRKET
jgi:hypothetical protein